MHFTRKVTDDLTWVGVDDRRLACFEGVYGVPDGVSYNSYLLQDEFTVLFDTVDKAVYQTFLFPIWNRITPIPSRHSLAAILKLS